MTTPKLKPNVDVKPVENPVVIEKVFSQRTPFDKIEASVTATLSTEAFRMRYADHTEFDALYGFNIWNNNGNKKTLHRERPQRIKSVVL